MSVKLLLSNGVHGWSKLRIWLQFAGTVVLIYMDIKNCYTQVFVEVALRNNESDRRCRKVCQDRGCCCHIIYIPADGYDFMATTNII